MYRNYLNNIHLNEKFIVLKAREEVLPSKANIEAGILHLNYIVAFNFVLVCFHAHIRCFIFIQRPVQCSYLQCWTFSSGHCEILQNIAKSAFSRTCQKCLFSIC